MADHHELFSEKFQTDPRLQLACSLILEALQEHQEQISAIRPPQQARIVDYAQLLTEFQHIRGAPLYFPYIGSGFGKGPLVELLDGSIKYDMISGIGPHYWGHSHPAMVASAFRASLSDTVMQGHLQQNLEALEISRLLTRASGLKQCFLSSSGAMANENGLKIALQKKAPAQRILAFEECFMGRTLALSQITDKPSYRDGLPTTVAVDYLPFYDPLNPEKSTAHSLAALDTLLRRYPGQHAVFCLELVQGEAGMRVGNREFFMALLRPLRERGILIFADEVQSFGRTPALFAFQHFGLDSYVDIVSIGKLSQCCATLFTEELKPKPGLLSQTFTSSSVALQTGRFIIEQLLNGEFFGPSGKIARVHNLFLQQLEALHKKYPQAISGPYGIGSMIAFTPFQGDPQRTAQFAQKLFHAGVISFIAGSHPTRIRFLPPIGSLENADILTVMDIVEQVIVKEL